MDEPKVKRCAGECKEEKLLSEFSFYRKRRGGGYNSECKKCSVARTQRWRHKNPEKYAAELERHSKKSTKE